MSTAAIPDSYLRLARVVSKRATHWRYIVLLGIACLVGILFASVFARAVSGPVSNEFWGIALVTLAGSGMGAVALAGNMLYGAEANISMKMWRAYERRPYASFAILFYMLVFWLAA